MCKLALESFLLFSMKLTIARLGTEIKAMISVLNQAEVEFTTTYNSVIGCSVQEKTRHQAHFGHYNGQNTYGYKSYYIKYMSQWKVNSSFYIYHFTFGRGTWGLQQQLRIFTTSFCKLYILMWNLVFQSSSQH